MSTSQTCPNVLKCAEIRKLTKRRRSAGEKIHLFPNIHTLSKLARPTARSRHNGLLCSDSDILLTVSQVAIEIVDYPAALLCNRFVLHVKTKERFAGSA